MSKEPYWVINWVRASGQRVCGRLGGELQVLSNLDSRIGRHLTQSGQLRLMSRMCARATVFNPVIDGCVSGRGGRHAQQQQQQPRRNPGGDDPTLLLRRKQSRAARLSRQVQPQYLTSLFCCNHSSPHQKRSQLLTRVQFWSACRWETCSTHDLLHQFITASTEATGRELTI